MISAVVLPVCIGFLGFGIDISYWNSIRLDLQHIADSAALAGAGRYASTLDPPTAMATAADVAELNGIPVGTRAGGTDGSTPLTDTYGSYGVTATYLASPDRIEVTVQRDVPLFFARVLSGASTQTIRASATADVTYANGDSTACVLGMNGVATGVTNEDDVLVTGGKNTQITLSGCDLRSEGNIAFNGNPVVDVPRIVASGTVNSVPTCPTNNGCDQVLQSMPQIPDPFAHVYGDAIGTMPSGSAGTPSGFSLSPPPAGTAYDSLSFGSGSYTLSPGTYYVRGSISINSSASVTGTGVTIISTGDLTINGNATVNLTPGSTGLLYGNPSSNSTITVNGTSSSVLQGAIYVPNMAVKFTGNSASGSAGCLEIAAKSVTFAGSSNATNSACANLGVPLIHDMPGTVALIQ